MITEVIKVFLPAVLCFFIAMLISVPFSNYLYRNKLWKKVAGKKDLSGSETPIFNSLHKDREVGTPKMGGALIWISCILTVTTLWIISILIPTDLTEKILFLSRSQTWIPLSVLVLGGLIGLIDDYLETRNVSDEIKRGGLPLSKRLFAVALIGLILGIWFYSKLDVSTIGLPFGSELSIGWLIIPLFTIVTLALYSGGVIDGIDGLAGGIFAIMFAAYAGIAFYQEQINLAAFSAMLAGGILAFLWYNIPPARFYMSETGSMALTLVLAVVAFMTDSLSGGHGLFSLPIIAFPLIATSASNVIQIISKQYFGKKVFRVAPIHHHFEAIGWPPYKVTMRYWVISAIFAIIGMILGFI
jgi:phospho-N-acetylmuramoyl-pentapeptide-transferase